MDPFLLFIFYLYLHYSNKYVVAFFIIQIHQYTGWLRRSKVMVATTAAATAAAAAAAAALMRTTIEVI
jgi:cysteine synthase